MSAGNGRKDWRAWVPNRWGWLRVTASPSSYLLVVAAVLTLLAKASIIADLSEVSSRPLWWLAVCAPDLSFYFGLGALFALGEGRAPWLTAVTVPLALSAAALAVINSIYLSIAGDQLNWQTFAVGLERFGEVTGIASVSGDTFAATKVLAMLVAVAVPALGLWTLKRCKRSLKPWVDARPRAHALSLIAGPALILTLVGPDPSNLALARIDGNAVVGTYKGWLAGDDRPETSDVGFAGYQPVSMVNADQRQMLAKGPRPNILMVVLESTRRDATTLASESPPAQTPNLKIVAQRGLEMTAARAVVPHTTKSLFSMLCGRMPLMQLALYEGSSSLEVECLPELLASAGWKTVFFQSALGVFEDRPRVVEQLGYQNFFAWEEIGGAPLGYLASDDESLAGAFAGWLGDLDSSQPFFATLLTSATHHPYQLSDAAAADAAANGRPTGSDRDRYNRLVEAEDRLIGQLLAELDKRQLTDTTIVIAIGDHGEGFGEKGVRQHDNNFFEEGLLVPWVIAGPGVPRGVRDGAASVMDLPATVLDAVGISLSGPMERSSPARSLLKAVPKGRLLPFSCWYDARCRGFIADSQKVVLLPEAQKAFWFDLKNDPGEQRPKALDQRLRGALDHANLIIDSFRTPDWPDTREPMNRFGLWTCPAGKPCSHPQSPPGGLFRKP